MNAQKHAYEYNRKILFESCGVRVSIKRGGVPILSTDAILATTKYEDADPTDGLAFVDFVDVLIYANADYTPQTGDVVDVISGDSYVAKPVASNLWKYDDPYNLVVRFHAQRRTITS